LAAAGFTAVGLALVVADVLAFSAAVVAVMRGEDLTGVAVGLAVRGVLVASVVIETTLVATEAGVARAVVATGLAGAVVGPGVILTAG
jgi:hypothetical protein